LQRQSLIELQDAIGQLSRAATSLATARRRRYADRNEWLPAEDFLVHYEAVSEARLPVISFTSRLEDAALREHVGVLREIEVALTTSETPQEALERQARLGDVLVPAIERCGELLRQS
jgi:hypothetical protein